MLLKGKFLPGCLLFLFFAITLARTQPIIVTQPDNQIVFGGTNVAFTVAVTGTGPFTYQWQFNGSNLPNDIITTVAGNGASPFVPNYPNDGGAATNAELSSPSGIIFDSAGNLFVSDSGNYRIRRVDTNGIITTVIGTGAGGYSGDGGSATNATINGAYGLVWDGLNNLYLADSGNNCIRKVDTNGVITTVAGNGVGGYSGDGGSATNASLNNPTGICFDPHGNLYIADTGNNLIRKVASDGKITTIAGGGSEPASILFSTYGYFPATNIQLSLPYGVVADTNGNIFIADTYDDRIEMVDTNDMLIVVAGHGFDGYSGDGGPATNATLARPRVVIFDLIQNLYIMDDWNQRVREVDSNGIINTIAGNGASGANGNFGGDGGAATNASFSTPRSLLFDASGNLYVADAGNNRIRVIDFGGFPQLVLNNVTLTNAGNYSVVITDGTGSVTSSVASLTVLLPPAIIAQPAGQTLPVGSTVNLNVNAIGTAPLSYQWLLNGTTSDGQTNLVLTLTNVSIGQAGGYTVVITNAYGSITSSVANLVVGYPPTISSQPSNQMVLNGGTAFFSAIVTGTGPLSYQWQLNGTNLPSDLITTFAGSAPSGFSGDGGMATNATLYLPVDIVGDKAGSFLIADSYNNRVRKVDASGMISTIAGKGLSFPSGGFTGDGGAATNANFRIINGVALDDAGDLFIADTGDYRIREVFTNGIVQTIAGKSPGYSGDGGKATNAFLNNVHGIFVDGRGNLFIADTSNNRIRKVDTNGLISTVAGNGTGGFLGDGGPATNCELNNPYDVTMDAAGALYIADYRNYRIRRVATNGVISTMAGSGSSYPAPGHFSGDNGRATNATLNSPQGVVVDAFGNIFIADTSNNRIRKIDTDGFISTVAGNGKLSFSGDGGIATNAALSFPTGVALDVSGNLFIADSANSRIRRVLLYADNPSLLLSALKLKDAGNYALVVTSPFGSVTNNIGNLAVLDMPIIEQTLAKADGSVTLSVVSTTNVSSRVYFSSSLGPTEIWIPIYTNQTGGIWQFMDTDVSSYPFKFYRVSTP